MLVFVSRTNLEKERVVLRKKSATIICSANGSSAPTATVIHISNFSVPPALRLQSLNLTNRFPRIQRFKPFWSPILLPPRPLLLDIMEKRDHVSQTILHLDIAKSQTQHQYIQLLTLSREG
jgi:hypothetical protein